MAQRQNQILPLVTVSGMKFEARCVAGRGVRALYGLDRERLANAVEEATREGAAAIVSFGTAGGLAPSLAPGSIVIAERVITAGGVYVADAEWSRVLRHGLTADGHANPVGKDGGKRRRGESPTPVYAADIFGADTPLLSAGQKTEAFAKTGAVAVDMESHLAAEIARKYNTPFAALRVVLDGAGTCLPPAALAGLRKDGSTSLFSVIAALAKDPRQFPAMLALASDHAKARRALLRGREALLLGLFGFLDAGKLTLDVE